MLRTLAAFAFVLLAQGALADVLAAQEVRATRQALINASGDADNPIANATVRLSGHGGLCTGTLIAPQVVVSAGHCGFYDGRQGWTPDRWFNVSNRNIVASFGPDSEDFHDVIEVTHANISGNLDVILLGLSRPIDASIAVPAPILYDLPVNGRRNTRRFLERQTFLQVGWGASNDAQTIFPTTRLSGVAREAILSDECGGDWFGICVRSTLGNSRTSGGDSGGPLYWEDGNGVRYLVGVLQGSSRGGANYDRYYDTFTYTQLAYPGDQLDGSATPWDQPVDLTKEQWLKNATNGTFCAVLVRNGLQDAQMRPLFHWYSPTRGDNYTTTSPSWAGCVGDQQQGYRLASVLGQVFSPDLPQPSGTVPLYQWWNPERKDNFVTTDSRWSEERAPQRPQGYRFVRIEGYVFQDRPNVSSSNEFPPTYKPLWSWYSSDRKDNFMTSDQRWAPGSRGGYILDYRNFRTEGYVVE